MDLWKSLEGMVEITITSGDSTLVLRQLGSLGITVYDARPGEDPLTLFLRIRRRDFRRVRALARKRGYDLKIRNRGGLYWTGKALLRRPVLAIGMLLFLILGLWLPTRIFFFRVEGNVSLPDRLILAQCQQIGMEFGASRKDVRSEKVKNALLELNPQLQWVGVNTSGCVATITVKERADAPENTQSAGVSSIVASRDGIVISCTAARGNLLCKVGQAVTGGEVLISGYTDCGISIRATQAEGEIYAQTSREITARLPENQVTKGEKQDIIKKYAIIIGKKRINFYKGSGISGSSCDKMYSEYYVTLPGGFQLPVCFVTEVWTQSDSADTALGEDAAATVLEDFSSRYLAQQMAAGTVTDRRETCTAGEGIYCLTGNYACIEMIGQQRNEDNIIGKYD